MPLVGGGSLRGQGYSGEAGGQWRIMKPEAWKTGVGPVRKAREEVLPRGQTFRALGM